MEIFPGSNAPSNQHELCFVLLLDKRLNLPPVEGMTIVLVTHDPKIAEYGDRNLYLRDGFILEDTVEA